MTRRLKTRRPKSMPVRPCVWWCAVALTVLALGPLGGGSAPASAQDGMTPSAPQAAPADEPNQEGDQDGERAQAIRGKNVWPSDQWNWSSGSPLN